MTREFSGTIQHNKGVAYAGLFESEKALECLEKAYESLEREEILKEIFMLCQLDEGAGGSGSHGAGRSGGASV